MCQHFISCNDLIQKVCTFLKGNKILQTKVNTHSLRSLLMSLGLNELQFCGNQGYEWFYEQVTSEDWFGFQFYKLSCTYTHGKILTNPNIISCLWTWRPNRGSCGLLWMQYTKLILVFCSLYLHHKQPPVHHKLHSVPTLQHPKISGLHALPPSTWVFSFAVIIIWHNSDSSQATRTALLALLPSSKQQSVHSLSNYSTCDLILFFITQLPVLNTVLRDCRAVPSRPC